MQCKKEMQLNYQNLQEAGELLHKWGEKKKPFGGIQHTLVDTPSQSVQRQLEILSKGV